MQSRACSKVDEPPHVQSQADTRAATKGVMDQYYSNTTFTTVTGELFHRKSMDLPAGEFLGRFLLHVGPARSPASSTTASSPIATARPTSKRPVRSSAPHASSLRALLLPIHASVLNATRARCARAQRSTRSVRAHGSTRHEHGPPDPPPLLTQLALSCDSFARSVRHTSKAPLSVAHARSPDRFWRCKLVYEVRPRRKRLRQARRYTNALDLDGRKE